MWKSRVHGRTLVRCGAGLASYREGVIEAKVAPTDRGDDDDGVLSEVRPGRPALRPQEEVGVSGAELSTRRRLWQSCKAGPKFDRSEVRPTMGAPGSGDIQFLRLPVLTTKPILGVPTRAVGAEVRPPLLRASPPLLPPAFARGVWTVLSSIVAQHSTPPDLLAEESAHCDAQPGALQHPAPLPHVRAPLPASQPTQASSLPTCG